MVKVPDTATPTPLFEYAPAPESRAVVDLGGRPWCETSLELVRPTIGALAAENVADALNVLRKYEVKYIV